MELLAFEEDDTTSGYREDVNDESLDNDELWPFESSCKKMCER
jgi:hypothetical protein